jgi:hypothetical protein
MPTFIPGLELSRRFYEDIVRPILVETFPALPYAAALIGPGSEVLGFDNERSTDHDWGARLLLFVGSAEAADQPDVANLIQTLSNLFSQQLPPTFLGYAVHFDQPPEEPRTNQMVFPVNGPVRHRVLVITLRDFARIQLGIDIHQPMNAVDWLTIPAHALGEMTAGAVYQDGIGELTALRQHLAWYPQDIWRYLLASCWQRIGQAEPLMPRAGEVGDELGSAIIGSRLVQDVMRLCFLLECQYAPYAKWFGTAFQRLPISVALTPILWQAQQASTWHRREDALVQGYEILAHAQNTLDLCPPVAETVSPFYTRPFKVIHGDMFAQALMASIRDPEVKRITHQRWIGNIDLWSDNTDIEGINRAALRHLYE